MALTMWCPQSWSEALIFEEVVVQKPEEEVDVDVEVEVELEVPTKSGSRGTKLSNEISVRPW